MTVATLINQLGEMRMSDVVLRFANELQYQAFLEKVKADVLKEIGEKKVYSSNWISVREQMYERLKNGYGDGCGQWYTNQQGLYSAFKLAFQVDAIRDLSRVDGDKIQSFYDELFALIDKYRGEE